MWKYGVMMCALISLLVGCTSLSPQETVERYTASAAVLLNPDEARDDAYRNALAAAEIEARDKLFVNIAENYQVDGNPIQRLMIAYPAIRAKVQDAVRSAPIISREVTEDQAEVEVALPVDQLSWILQDY